MKFEIGEIAVFVSHSEDWGGELNYNGMDCEIINPLGASENFKEEKQYGVKFADDVEMWVIEPSLRKKKPPKEIDWVKMCNLKVLEAV